METDTQSSHPPRRAWGRIGLAIALAICACPAPTASGAEPDDLLQLTEMLEERWSGDLDGMVERNLIRVLVVENRTHYFVDGAELHGPLDQGVGDFNSRHTYRIKLRRPSKKDPRIYFISEYGGYNLQEKGHLWDEGSKFGYGTFGNEEALAEAYARQIRRQLIPLISRGLGAAVYTQWSDVEIESNGLFTYDRKILKIDPARISALNTEIYQAFEALEGKA